MPGFPGAEAGGFLFSVFWVCFFRVSFLYTLWEVLDGPLRALGSILEPFGEHLGVILVTF